MITYRMAIHTAKLAITTSRTIRHIRFVRIYSFSDTSVVPTRSYCFMRLFLKKQQHERKT